MLLQDHRVEIADGARITRDGYLVAEALVARANNIQTYRAAELGLNDREPDAVVRIFRPEEEVFARDALSSLAHRPITINHPAGDVGAENWKRLAVGDTGDEIIRDGERIRVPIKVMDSEAIDSIRTSHREFSLGYNLTLDMTPGEHAGQAYDGVARSIRYNHLAAVRAARGGPELRIVDERPDPKEKAVKKIVLDGLQVDLTDADAVTAAIEKLQGQAKAADEAKDKALADVAALTTDKATLEAKVATLEKQVADAAITPAKLRDAAKAYAVVVGKAKALGVQIADDMDEPAIMKAVVSAKLGDVAKDWTDDQIAVSFATLAKDVKAGDEKPGVTPIHAPAAVTDEANKAYDEMVNDLTSAWKPKQAA